MVSFLKVAQIFRLTSIPGDMYPSTGVIEKSGANFSASQWNLAEKLHQSTAYKWKQIEHRGKYGGTL